MAHSLPQPKVGEFFTLMTELLETPLNAHTTVPNIYEMIRQDEFMTYAYHLREAGFAKEPVSIFNDDYTFVMVDPAQLTEKMRMLVINPPSKINIQDAKFALAVMLNPGAKHPGGFDNTNLDWKIFERAGLITCVGSWKWQPLPKFEEILTKAIFDTVNTPEEKQTHFIRSLPIVIHHDEGSAYGVTVPGLPGCHVGGDTLEEALTNAKEVIRDHVATMLEGGGTVVIPRVDMNSLMADPQYAGGVWSFVKLRDDSLEDRSDVLERYIPKPDDHFLAFDRYNKPGIAEGHARAFKMEKIQGQSILAKMYLEMEPTETTMYLYINQYRFIQIPPPIVIGYGAPRYSKDTVEEQQKKFELIKEMVESDKITAVLGEILSSYLLSLENVQNIYNVLSETK